MNTLEETNGMRALKLLRNRRAWVRWINDEAQGPDGEHGPLRYPCYAFTTTRSYGYEEEQPRYLYTSDVQEMSRKLSAELRAESTRSEGYPQAETK